MENKGEGSDTLRDWTELLLTKTERIFQVITRVLRDRVKGNGRE